MPKISALGGATDGTAGPEAVEEQVAGQNPEVKPEDIVTTVVSDENPETETDREDDLAEDDDEADDEPYDYSGWTAEDLKGEIARRNDDGRFSRLVSTGSKADLIGRLQADD